ncbi:hypothetical protein RIF29_09681 [Crotalaria pallida]|uniref:Reverse transcriptase n=1 Tax=Crotalaria pallida TaxID=3830 RepID=A0AAN9FS24_CROPI
MGSVQWVRDLIDQDLIRWNRPLIYSIFSESEAAHIEKIPLRNIMNHDSLFWPYSKDGDYSVRSGYNFILNPYGDVPSSSIQHPHFPWKKLWAVQVIPRVKEIVWRAAKNILPTNQRLLERGIRRDPICPLCGMEVNTITHALLQCKETRCIWFASPITIHIPVGEELNFTEWIFRIIHMGGKEGSANVFNLIFSIWKRRNKWHKKESIDETIRTAASWNYSTPLSLPYNNSVQVQNPPNDNVIVEIDAALKYGVGTGFGCVITNKEGAFLAATTWIEAKTLEPRVAEAKALRWCLNFMEAVGLTHVSIFTDCLELVQAWNKKGKYNTYFDTMIQDSIELYRPRRDNAIPHFFYQM